MARSPSSPLAVSLGDPAGIGPEVIAKCWDHRSAIRLPPFVAIGDPRSIAAVWDGPIELIDDPRQADCGFDHALPSFRSRRPRRTCRGIPSVAGAHCSLDSLELAVGLARSGSASAVVTGPVSKEQLYSHWLRSIPARPNLLPNGAAFRLATSHDACRSDFAHRSCHHAPVACGMFPIA